MMRWSKEPVTVILWTGWKALPSHTGSTRMLPTARMQLSGGLTMAMN